jgi:hypothetical protein
VKGAPFCSRRAAVVSTGNSRSVSQSETAY